jgi:hypothetical protein
MKFLFAVIVTAAFGAHEKTAAFVEQAQCNVLCFADPCMTVTDCPFGQQCQPHYDRDGCQTCELGECKPISQFRKNRKRNRAIV